MISNIQMTSISIKYWLVIVVRTGIMVVISATCDVVESLFLISTEDRTVRYFFLKRHTRRTSLWQLWLL